ncbi:hypothetical protein AAMO2058_000682300 [Amorphochlora amoebiformis]
MVGSAPFFLLLCLPSFSASVTFPVQRADKATIPVDIITAAKNDSNKGIVKSTTKVHSQALTNSACANYRVSSTIPLTVTFNSVTYSSILRSLSQADDAPNPSAALEISAGGSVLTSETISFDGFCPVASSDFNLLIVGPKSQTTSSPDLTINFFTGVGANKCSFTPGSTIRVFFVNVVQSTGTYYHSELKLTAAESLASPVSSTPFNQASIVDLSFTTSVANHYTYVTFKPTVGPSICLLCLIYGSTGSAGIWLTFFGSDSLPQFGSLGRSTPPFMNFEACSPSADCVGSGSAPSSPTPFPVASTDSPTAFPTPIVPTAFPTTPEPGVNLISSCITSFLDVFFPGGSYRVSCSVVDTCTGAVIGCPLNGASILSTSSLCTAARLVGIQAGQTFTVVHTGRVDSLSGCTANGATAIPQSTPYDFSYRISTDGSTPPPNVSPQNGGSDSGSNTAAIAGGVVGGVVAIAIGGVLAAVYFFSRNRANPTYSKEQPKIRHRDNETDNKFEMEPDTDSTAGNGTSNTAISAALGNALV